MARLVTFYTYYDKYKFLKKCEDEFTVLHNTYGYYFCNLCTKINDIENVIKKKKDYYNHRCNIYYTDDECFFVAYKKYTIIIEVLLECQGNQIGHKLAKDLEKMNIVKEEEIKPW